MPLLILRMTALRLLNLRLSIASMLVKQIAKLPSLGTRSSRRIVLQLLKKRENLLLPLIESLNEVIVLIFSKNTIPTRCGILPAFLRRSP